MCERNRAARACGRLAVVLLTLAALACGAPEERLASHLERADEHLAAGRADQGLIELRNALKIDPQNAQTNLRIARILNDRGNLGDALFFYAEAHRLDPSLDEAALGQAKILAFDDPQRAAVLVEGTLERNPGNPEAHLVNAEVALARADTGEALEAALTARELQPDFYRVHLQLGVVHEARIRERFLLEEPPDPQLYEQALAAFERAIELAGDAPPSERIRAWMERARVLAAWPGHRAEALAAFQEAADQARPWPEQEERVLATAGGMAMIGRQLDLLEWAYSRLVELRPENRAAWVQLARLKDESGRDGMEVYERMLAALPSDSRSHAIYARELSRRGRRAEAVAHLEAVASEVEDPARLWVTVVELELADRDLKAARGHLERLRRDYPEDPGTERVAAQLDLAEGRTEQAAERLRSLSGRDENSTVLALLAEAELRLGRGAAAREAIDRALELTDARGTGLVALQRQRIRVLERTGDWETLIRVAQRMRRIQGGELSVDEKILLARAYYSVGNAPYARGLMARMVFKPDAPVEAVLLYARNESKNKPDEVRDLLLATLERRPGDARVVNQLTEIDVAAGRAAEARARIDALLAARPSAPVLRLMRARVLSAEGRLAEAAEDARVAVSALPDDPATTGFYVRLLGAQGRLDEAASVLEKREEQGSLDNTLRIVLARIEMQRGESQRAIALFESVLEDGVERPWVANDLAFLLAEGERDLDRALELARKARAALPAAPEVADTLGYVYLKRGLPEVALAQLQEAASLAKRQPETPLAPLQYHLGLAFKAAGRTDDAVLAFRKAVELASDSEAGQSAQRELEALAQESEGAANAS